MKKGYLLIVFAIIAIVIALGLRTYSNSESAKAAEEEKLPQDPYVITDFGNGVYLIEINTAVPFNDEFKDRVRLGLAKIKKNCAVIGWNWDNTETASSMTVTTTLGCNVAAKKYNVSDK